MDHYYRQNLLKMQQEISNLKKKLSRFSTFISNMNSIFNDLKYSDDVWDELFMKEMLVLESANSCVYTEENYMSVFLEEISKLESLVNDRLQSLGVEITLEEVIQKYIDILEDKINLEDADRWASSIIKQHELGNIIFFPNNNKDKIWKGLMYLFGIDLQVEPGIFFHTKDDIRKKMEDLK